MNFFCFFFANICSLSGLLISSCQLANHLALLFYQFYTSPCLMCVVASCCPSFLHIFFHHSRPFSSIFPTSCFIRPTATQTRKRSSDSVQLLHKSRKYKSAFLPHRPISHFPYLAVLTKSLSRLATMLLY